LWVIRIFHSLAGSGSSNSANSDGVILGSEKSGDLPAYKWKSDEQAYGVHKRYVALALGTPRTTAFAVDAPIARHPHHKFARIVAAQPEDGAHALTFFYMVFIQQRKQVSLKERAEHVSSSLWNTLFVEGKSKGVVRCLAGCHL